MVNRSFQRGAQPQNIDGPDAHTVPIGDKLPQKADAAGQSSPPRRQIEA